MKRLLVAMLVLWCGSTFAQNGIIPVPAPAPVPAKAPANAPPLPALQVPVVKVAPSIDGVLDDAAWKEAASGEMSKLNMGQDAKGKTRFLVARDDKRLYLAVECFDEAETLKNLVAKVDQHDGMSIWDDDCIEIFIDPTNERVSFYQIIVNSKNATWDGFHSAPGAVNQAWDAEMKTATKVSDKSWTLEMAIPFSEFTMTNELGASWAFNLSRMRTVAKEISYWSPVMAASSHTPERFGTLAGMPKGSPFGEAPPRVPREPARTTPPETLLLDFETPDDAAAWTPVKLPEVPKGDPARPGDAVASPAPRVASSPEHATRGERSLKITFDGGEWPAVATRMLTVPENVFDYPSLKLDVTASRPCLVALRILQEKSEAGLGWDASVTRWNAALSLKEGRNEITRKLPGRADWEALSPKFGKVTTFIVAMYHPRKGESIFIDNVRLSAEKPWPRLTTFKVLGTDLMVSGVEELNAKLNREWTKPEAKTADAIEAEFRAQYDDLKKTHPRALLAVFRQGAAGFDPRAPANAFSGWADTHVNSHSPDGVNPGRLENFGGTNAVETFMRHRSSLMRVDVSSIPAGSNVLAARLVIQGADFSKSDDKSMKDSSDVSKPNLWVAEACNRPWVEGEANAYEYARDKFWTSTGGMNWDGPDPDFLPVFLAHGPSQGPTSSWDFTEAVKFWTSGTQANHGFMLHGTGVPYMRTFTKEHKDAKLRALLMVVYEPK